MKLQILVSSLNQEVKSLAEKMNLQADAILINQCNENRYEEWTQDGHRIRCYHLAERGVGLSRNNALLRADADLCLFSDEDIVYDDGAVERIIEGFEQHPEADMLLFNVRVQESRFTYWNSFYKRVRWYNCGRYPAYSFALRTAKMHEKNLTYSLLFGGGAKYANGVSDSRTSMIASTISRPIRSPRARGPMGWFAPSFIAVSISSTLATPSA